MSIRNYHPSEAIAHGAFGTVYLANKDGKAYAVKVMLRERVKLEAVRMEAKLQRKAFHPNILAISDYFVEPSRVYLVFPYMTGGSLSSFLKKSGAPPSEADTKKLVAELLTGVAHLHSLSIVHRDLKPENVLIDHHGIAKIADFGSATEVIDGKPLTGFVGTRGFMAPEILNLQPYTNAVDLFAVGVSVLELVLYPVNVEPCPADELQRLIPADADQSLRDFLASLLEVDAPSRATADNILRHRWLAL